MNPYDPDTDADLHEAYERAVRNDDDRERAESKESKSTSDILVDIAEGLYEFGMSDQGEAYGVPRTGPRVVFLLRGGRNSLRAQLSAEYRKRVGKVAPQQALASAMLCLDGIAQEAAEGRLYTRVAEHGGTLWLDLCDHSGQAVRVTGAGWTVEDKPPVLFKRTMLNGSLPLPAAANGGIGELWRWLNVAERDRPLVAAWLVSVLFCDIPHPVLGLFGEQGTGKTTAAKLLVSLVDPGPVPVRKPPRDAESWVTAASGSWVVSLDNMSWVPDWLSDSLCRAVTGDGDVRRRLYTDGDLAVFAFRRCVILNGIDVGAMRGDLAERMLPITLDLIPDEQRRAEETLWHRWRDAHPYFLGGLLDLTAGVLAALPDIRLSSRPRMADFARVLAAADTVLGTDGLALYRSRSIDLAADGLSADPLADELRRRTTTEFIGTSAELLDRVAPTVLPKGWPANARKCTAQLRRIAPALRKIGWTVTDLGPDSHNKIVRWRIIPPSGEKPDNDTRTPPHTSSSAGDAGVSGDSFGSSPDHSLCDVCHEPMVVFEPEQRTHPNCEPGS